MKLLNILLFISIINSVQCQKLRKNRITIPPLNNIDVYLRIGDSHEAGGTAVQQSDFPLKYNVILNNSMIYFKPDRTATANGQWLSVSDSNPTINHYSGYGPIASYPQPYQVGPSQSFAFSLDSSFKKKVAIIKCGLGGTTLVTDWASGSAMYNFFIPYSSVGLATLTNATVKAVIVRLGTNDCAAYNNTNFKAAIQSLVSRIRTDLGLINLHVYWVQVNTNLSAVYNPASVTAARAAIDACANISDPAYINNFHVLNYDSDALLPDGVHYTQNSCISQGINEALTMIALGE